MAVAVARGLSAKVECFTFVAYTCVMLETTMSSHLLFS